MIPVIFWLLVILLVSGMVTYVLFLGVVYRGLGRIRNQTSQPLDLYPRLSVIIPARDEEKTIGDTLDYLLNQDYPQNRLQIIVVNDRSVDATAEIVNRYRDEHPHIELVNLTECPASMSPKKHALTRGIKHATGDIIVTTDADCRFHPRWLTMMVGHFAADVGVVAGLTRFHMKKEKPPLWQNMQWLDFISHSFVSAGAIGSGMTFNCNGSNLAYRRKVFDEVHGFSGIDRIVSGDDEFFAQKVNQHTPWKIRFAYEPPTIVLSQPVETVRELFQQRFRWGSKGLLYRPLLKTVLIITYLYYLALFLGPIIGYWLPYLLPVWGIALIVKIGMDLSVLLRGCRVFGIRRVLDPIVMAEILHIPMIILFSTAGHLFSFRWKGANFRSVRKAAEKPVGEAA